ncbi:LOW QUALITY PROTEIN: hypothetical protein YC2023_049068 [Brassica napus]
MSKRQEVKTGMKDTVSEVNETSEVESWRPLRRRRNEETAEKEWNESGRRGHGEDEVRGVGALRRGRVGGFNDKVLKRSSEMRYPDTNKTDIDQDESKGAVSNITQGVAGMSID